MVIKKKMGKRGKIDIREDFVIKCTNILQMLNTFQTVGLKFPRCLLTSHNRVWNVCMCNFDISNTADNIA